VIRYVTSAGQHVSAEDVRAAIQAVTPEGDAVIGTIAHRSQIEDVALQQTIGA